MVKYLYVDEKIRKDATIPKLEERLELLHANVDSSIDVRHQLELPASTPMTRSSSSMSFTTLTENAAPTFTFPAAKSKFG